MIETSIERIQGEKTLTVYTGEQKFINEIKKLKEAYPDDIDIRDINPNGSMVVHMPAKWLKFPKPPIKRAFTDEQRQATSERLKAARKNHTRKGTNN